MKKFSYDGQSNLVEENTIVKREEWTAGASPKLTWQDEKTYVTSYEYNKYNKPIRTIGPKGMVSETVYDNNGRALRNVTYHISNPSDKVYSEKEVAENGQIVSETDETGENITKFEYVKGTNVIDKVTSPDGQVTSFGRDPHTDDVLGASTVVDDIKNSTVYNYAKDSTILDCGNTKIEHIYDEFGREKKIKVNSETYVSFVYGKDNDKDIVTATYANGEEYKTISDKFGKVIEVQHKEKNKGYEVVLQNSYDSEDRLITSLDLVSGEATNYTYDKDGNVTKKKCGDVEVLPRFNSDRNRNTTVFKITTYEPNNTNGLDKVIKEQSYTDNYDNEGEFVSVRLPSGDVIETQSDDLGRVTGVKDHISTTEYGYLQREDHATGIVNRLVHKNKDGSVNRTRYFYDANGNIKEIRNMGKLVVRYRYDGLSRLIREDNADLDKTETYEYDGNGNILYKTVYQFTVSDVLTGGVQTEYAYKGDRLTKFGSDTVDYNGTLPGNPSSYRGRSLQWSHLRDLRKIDDIHFKYDAAGTRIAKEQDNMLTKYHRSGDLLLAERRVTTVSDSIWDMIVDEELPIFSDSTLIRYVYGTNGVIGFTIKRNTDAEETYYFQRNLQGDIMRIYPQICDEDRNTRLNGQCG